jgi:hypothetical protein
MTKAKELSTKDRAALLATLEKRFAKNRNRHKRIDWTKVKAKLEKNTKALWSLHEMEKTGGEPDVIGLDKKTNEFIFCDCSPESPAGRRSFCYDREALQSRKEHKPKNSVMDMAASMGIDVLDEEGYKSLQKLGKFDLKSQSWLKTPAKIRALGGAIFGDYRFGTVFIYCNGAESYYAARGFRGSLRV